MQPQGHVQIVMNLIDFGMNLQEAGDAPRIQHEARHRARPARTTAMSDGGVVDLESGFPYETVRALMRKGHSVRFADGPVRRLPGDHVATRRPACTSAPRESRKDGQAAGY